MLNLRILISRLVALFRKQRLEKELDEEVRSHLEMLVEENLRKGVSREEARYAALRSFGGVEQVKEIYREGRGLPMIETLFQDLRYGFRMLARSPGFTAVVVLTLALGIGANTAIFSVVNAVLLRPLPYKHPEHLVTFVEHVPGIGKMPWVDPHLFVELRQQSQIFEQIAAYDWSDTAITGRADPEQVARVEATASVFPLLGLQPTLGRAFSAADEQSGRNNVVLLSRNLWQRRFGSDPKLIGQTIRLDGRIFTVIGIMPGGLRLPAGSELWTPDLWTPMTLDLAAPMQHLAITVARRKEGVRLERIQADVDVVVRRRAAGARRRGGFAHTAWHAKLLWRRDR